METNWVIEILIFYLIDSLNKSFKNLNAKFSLFNFEYSNTC